MSVHMTIELEETEEARLRALADHQNVSLEDFVKQVVSERLNDDRSFHEAVQRGMEDVAAGRVFTHEEVMARSAKRRAELLARNSKA